MQTRAWKQFFADEAPRYLDNVFTENTVAEVDFLVEELKLQPGQSILDVGCGTGRHSLELTRRGYRCTGIDQSPDMLRVARSAAEAEGLEISFVQGSAETTTLDQQFDHAICLCEGAVSLLEVGVDPVPYHRSIFKNIAAMLYPGAGFLLTALNGCRLVREHKDADVASGHFDPVTTSHIETMPLDSGKTVQTVEKGFFPEELRLLLEGAGFQVHSFYGGTAGDWGRRAIALDEIELMVVARRA